MPHYEWITEAPTQDIPIETVAAQLASWDGLLQTVIDGPDTYSARLSAQASQVMDVSTKAQTDVAQHVASLHNFLSGMPPTVREKLKNMPGNYKARGYYLDGMYVGVMVYTIKMEVCEIKWLLCHPAVSNAGDILIEWLLGAAGQNARISLTAVVGARKRYRELGFEGEEKMTLVPSKHPNIWKLVENAWKRCAVMVDNKLKPLTSNTYGASPGVPAP